MEANISTSGFIIDESMLSADANAESAIIATYELEGSHHGVGIPINDGVVLQSLATMDRIAQVNGTSSLPSTFQVVDYDGNVLEQFGDTSDPSQSCYEFHGSSHIGNKYFFACSHDPEQHGGIFVVEYDETTQTFSTSHLLYPETALSNHRAGGILAHDESGYVVTDFADWEAELYAPHLMAFHGDESVLSSDRVLVLGESGQCEYGFELAEGKLIVVLLPNGKVQVYELPTWQMLAEADVFPAFTDGCPWPAPFATGYMQAFTFTNQTLIALDLAHVYDGEIDVHKLELDFAPYNMAVAGVPEGFVCHGEHEHNHGNEDTSGNTEEDGSAMDGNSNADGSATAASNTMQTWLAYATLLCVTLAVNY
jgi:hypothetical protein